MKEVKKRSESLNIVTHFLTYSSNNFYKFIAVGIGCTFWVPETQMVEKASDVNPYVVERPDIDKVEGKI